MTVDLALLLKNLTTSGKVPEMCKNYCTVLSIKRPWSDLTARAAHIVCPPFFRLDPPLQRLFQATSCYPLNYRTPLFEIRHQVNMGWKEIDVKKVNQGLGQLL